MYFVARIPIKKVDSFRIFQESCSLCITTKILIRKADGFVSIDFCLLLYSRFCVIKIFHFFRFAKWIWQLFHLFYSCMPLVWTFSTIWFSFFYKSEMTLHVLHTYRFFPNVCNTISTKVGTAKFQLKYTFYKKNKSNYEIDIPSLVKTSSANLI